MRESNDFLHSLNNTARIGETRAYLRLLRFTILPRIEYDLPPAPNCELRDDRWNTLALAFAWGAWT